MHQLGGKLGESASNEFKAGRCVVDFLSFSCTLGQIFMIVYYKAMQTGNYLTGRRFFQTGSGSGRAILARSLVSLRARRRRRPATVTESGLPAAVIQQERAN